MSKIYRDAVIFAGTAASILAGLAVVAVFLALVGRDPIATYGNILLSAFGDRFAISETLVAATPVMLCALAVAVAAWVGLLNIGVEGQLLMGAVGAAAVALSMPTAEPWQALPAMCAGACAAGAIWSGIPGWLRARLGVNETIVTLLMNYVAILIIEFLIHGPWQDPATTSWPQSASFCQAAQLPGLFATRLHAGFFVGVLLALVLALVMAKTKAGFCARVLGANPKAAQYAHIPIVKYLVVSMLVSGAIAAVAGFAQVSAIEGRLRSGLSPGYGYSGFLVCWLARHNPIAIVAISILMGGFISGADSLQLSEKLPFATVNILQAVIFLFLLASEMLVARQSDKASLSGLHVGAARDRGLEAAAAGGR